MKWALKLKDSIRLRILAILAMVGVSSVLTLAVVEFTADATHRHMVKLSTSLIPAAMQLVQAEAAFEQVKKRSGEAVLLEEPAALNEADKEANAVGSALQAVGISVASSPELTA